MQEKLSAPDRRKPLVKQLDILPLHNAGANAVRQVQRVDQHEAPRAGVFLHAGMQPFERSHDALQMSQVGIYRERPIVFRHRQWTVSMRLRQMNQRAHFSGLTRADMTADQRIDERRLPDARRAFDQQCLERDHAV